LKMVDHDNDHPEITIETLTTPPIQIQPAPLARRLGATLIDSLFVGLVWMIIARASVQSSLLGLSLLTGSVLFLISFLYYSTLEWLLSATLGKRAMKLRVVGINGDACSLRESALRNLFRIVDWLPFCYILGIGFLSTSEKRQRAGDKIAHTIVTIAPERDNTPPPAPFLFH
jgi:uncharacterized RDD family membrane protein YckC